MSGTYHYHYAAIVWNKDDFSDIHILKHSNWFFGKVILFDSKNGIKDYAKERGFNNCEVVNLFHTKM